MADQVNMWYKERGINVVRLFQVPMINYKMEDIVSTITSELSSGIITICFFVLGFGFLQKTIKNKNQKHK